MKGMTIFDPTTRKRQPGLDMKFRIGLVMALLAVAGCSTTRLENIPAAPSVASLFSPRGSSASGGAVAQTIISAMDGGLIGGMKGLSLSAADRTSALEAEYRALEYMPNGQAVDWQGKGGVGGQVVAAQPYRVGSQDCRQYSHAVTMNGGKQTVRGTACRDANGSWTPLT